MHVEQLSLFDEFDLEHKELCPFLNRKVSVTGVFTLGRQALKSKLLKLGASDVRFDALQRNTHFYHLNKQLYSLLSSFLYSL